MKFCQECGKKLDLLKSPSSWESRFRCPGKACGMRYQVTYGDAMGGSRDVTTEREDPFENEEVLQ